MEKWRRISLVGILLGNGALLIDYFVISVPYIIMIPILFVASILIFSGLIMRKKHKNDLVQKECSKSDGEFKGQYTEEELNEIQKQNDDMTVIDTLLM